MSIFVESTSFTEVVTDTTDTSSNLASATSTPPTTIADSSSLHSESPKRDDAVHSEDTVTVEEASLSRPRRARVSAPVYNLVQLSGTAGHGKRRAKGDIVANRRRTISDFTFGEERLEADAGEQEHEIQVKKPTRHGIDALDLHRSLRSIASPRTRSQAHESPRSQRLSSRLAGAPVSAVSKKLSTMGKRNRKSLEKGSAPMSRELRRLQDTKEFAHIDDRPVLHTVWSNGKYVDLNAPKETPGKAKAQAEAKQDEPEQAEAEPITKTRKRRVKKYLDKGLYAGQETPLDMSKGLSIAEKKKLAQLPELIPSGRVNKTMPSPMFNGLRTLIAGRDFKLPYHICNPLPPGQPKPDEWKKMTKSELNTAEFM